MIQNTKILDASTNIDMAMKVYINKDMNNYIGTKYYLTNSEKSVYVYCIKYRLYF